MFRSFAAAFTLFSLIFSGCEQKVESPPPKPPPPERTLVIGLVPERNVFNQLDRYKPLAGYIGKRTGYSIKLIILPGYGAVIDDLKEGMMDGAFLGSFSYAIAHKRFGLEVLASPEKTDGLSTCRGELIARKSSGIRRAADMRGRTFAFVDKATTAGYLLPLVYFRENGIGNYRGFMKTYFAGSQEDVIHDVLNGKADAGAAMDTEIERAERDDRKAKEELVVLDKSPWVPDGCFAVRKDMDPMLKKMLKAVLLEMNRDSEGAQILARFGAKRFVGAAESDYGPVYMYCEKAGLDIYKFDYDPR